VKIKGYDALDKFCPQRWCWSPGNYEHRGATGSSGSRNTGSSTKCCLENAYRGCPQPLPEPGAKSPWKVTMKIVEFDVDVLRGQVDSLRAALTKVLDTQEESARAQLSYENAQANFSDGGIHEKQQYFAAMRVASHAEKEARNLLLNLEALGNRMLITATEIKQVYAEIERLRDLLQRMLEAPTTQISVTWKEEIRQELAQRVREV